MKTTLNVMCLASVFTVLLAGCSTSPKELMASTPDVVHSSEKSAAAVARCIDSKWEETRVIGGSPYVDTKQADSGLRVSMRLGDKLHYLALVSDRGTGSKTQLWTYMVVGGSKAKDDVTACQ